MLRITTTNRDRDVTVKLEGRLLKPWIDEFSSACRVVNPAELALDLSGVSFVDEAGVSLLRSLLAQGVKVATSSSFVSELLKTDQPAVNPTSEESEEAKLLEGLRRGDDDACARFMRTYYGRMKSIARRLLADENDRADAVQDAMISALQSIDRFEGGSRLWTWLHRITINSCLMKRRAQSRRRAVSIEELLPKFDETGHHTVPVPTWRDEGFDHASAQETRKLVRERIDQLPEPYRTVLLLRDIEQLSTEETAKLTKTTVSNVKTRLHRARQALRTLLAPMFAEA